MQRRPLKEIPLRKITSSPLARTKPIVDRTPNHFSEGSVLSPRSPNPGATDSWTIFQDDEQVKEGGADESDCPTPSTLSDEDLYYRSYTQADNEDEGDVVDENENPPMFTSFKSPIRRPPLMSFRHSSTPSLVSSQPFIAEEEDEDDNEDDGETPKYNNTAKPRLTPFKTPQSASKAQGKRMLECEDEFDSPMSSLLNSAAKRRRLLD